MFMRYTIPPDNGTIHKLQLQYSVILFSSFLEYKKTDIRIT
jgi:hypothetical protein